MSTIEESKESKSFGLFSSIAVKNRVKTAFFLGIPVLIAISITAQWPFALVLVLVTIVSCNELSDLLSLQSRWGTSFATLALIASLYLIPFGIPVPLLCCIPLAIGTLSIALRVGRKTPAIFDYAAIGWIAAPITIGLWLHGATLDPTRLFSPNLLAMLLLPLWIGDTAAYFIGKHFGKRPLAPVISPKKTIEGSIANLAAAILVSIILSYVFGASLWAGLATGFLIGTIGQLGDLLQSALKRSCQRKDSSNLLPGHGGLLDRMDSYYLSAVPAGISLWITALHLFHVKQ